MTSLPPRPTPLTIWLPVLGSSSGLATIVTVYWLTFRDGLPHGSSTSSHHDVAIVTPPISLLGCQEPAHTAYQVGFAVTAVVLGGVIVQWTRCFFAPIAAQFGWTTAWSMRMGAYLAVVGLAGQGIVTLQADLWDKILRNRQDSGSGGRFTLEPQSIWHQQLAAVFFLGAALHCYTTVYYCLAASASSLQYKSPTSRRLKYVAACLSIVSYPLAVVMHPARTQSADAVNWNVGGLAQYITVGSYIVFFGSYALDFAHLQETKGDKAS